MYDVSVISSCLNESRNVVELTERLEAVFAKENIRGEIVLVDDGSTDDTSKLMQELAGRFPNVKIIIHSQNRGIVKGWQSGLKVACGTYVCLIDSDLQNLPEDVGRLYKEILWSHVDAVQGWRNHIGRLQDSWLRHIASRGLNALLNFVFGMSMRDNKSGFVVCRKSVLEDILVHRFSYTYYQTFISVAAKYKGYSIKEVETLFQDRLLGKSYIRSAFKSGFLTLVDVIKGFFEFRFISHYDNSLRHFVHDQQSGK